MITIKLPYNNSSEEFQQKLKLLQTQYSSIVRYSFNRFREGEKELEIRHSLKELSNIHNLNSWLKLCGVRDAKGLFKRVDDDNENPNNKVIFGGKKNFKLRAENKISKEEFQRKRLRPLNSEGESWKKGNRHFKLDIIENNKIIFKLNKKEHFDLFLPNIRSNYKKLLYKLEQLNDLDSYKKIGYTFSVKLTDSYITISFEEFQKEKSNLKNNRYIGIDMNPMNIGICVMENDKIIHSQEFNFKKIFDKILNEKLKSTDNRMKYFQNKLKFETFQISKTISNLAKYYCCKNVFFEDLNFKQKLSKKQKNNHIGNRKNRNLWKRNIFINNLKKRLNILNIKFHEVNAAYSTFIGNLQHDYVDSINSSIEIARRGYEFFVEHKKNKFYPIFQLKKSILHYWKEMEIEIVGNWVEFYKKNPKMKYRVSLEKCKYNFKVFQQNSNHKSLIERYIFYD